MEWKIITKKVKNNGQTIIVETDEQVDEVGNIYQKQGGVIPKACQKCKKEFKSSIEDFPITQKVPFYSCSECKFENASGDAALDHKLENVKHNIKKITKNRVISIEKRIVGIISYITQTDNNCIILCQRCK